MKDVRMSNIQLFKIIVRCEQRDGPPRPSAHHVTARLKNKTTTKKKQKKEQTNILIKISRNLENTILCLKSMHIAFSANTIVH